MGGGSDSPFVSNRGFFAFEQTRIGGGNAPWSPCCSPNGAASRARLIPR